MGSGEEDRVGITLLWMGSGAGSSTDQLVCDLEESSQLLPAAVSLSVT